MKKVNVELKKLIPLVLLELGQHGSLKADAYKIDKEFTKKGITKKLIRLINQIHDEISKNYIDVKKFDNFAILTNLIKYQVTEDVNLLKKIAGKYSSMNAQTEAIKWYEYIYELSDLCAEDHFNLANNYKRLKKYKEALSHYRLAVTKQPDAPKIWYNSGNTLRELSQFNAAEKAYKLALKYEANYADAWCNLGNLYRSISDIDRAIDCYKRALLCDAEFISNDDKKNYWSNLCMSVNYSSGYSSIMRYETHKAAAGFYSKGSAYKSSTPHGKLKKIGFVSNDICQHSVTEFLRPIFSKKPSDLSLHIYSTNVTVDEITTFFKEKADDFKIVNNLNTKKLCEVIMDDKIDILIDLSGHSSGNRLDVFACKPAPIQISWLGYPATTGLKEIDYRITSNYVENFEQQKHYHSEQLIDLKPFFLCYDPFNRAKSLPPLEISPKPFVIGSFNHAAKINNDVMLLIATMLKEIDGARLLMKNGRLNDLDQHEHVFSYFEMFNISRERITLLGYHADRSESLEDYDGVDVAIDSFPYSGTTTTFEALSRYVPILTLRSNQHAHNVTSGILQSLGLDELVFHTKEDLVKAAKILSMDQNKLVSLKRKIKNSIEESPIYNAQEFSKNFYSLLKIIWESKKS